MDAPLPVAPSALSPAELGGLTEQLRTGSLAPLQASEQVMAGGVLLTHDAEVFFGEVLKRGGSAVADLILDHLAMLRVGHTSASAAKYLANLLLDYSTDPDVARKLLSWYPDLIDNPAVLMHLQINDETDLGFYQQFFLQLIRDVDSYRAASRVSEILVATLKHSPAWVGKLLSILQNVQTEINLDTFLKTAAEIGTAKEVLYDQLPLIGRITAQWSRVVEWILSVYPDRRIEALGKLLEQSRIEPYLLEQAFVLLARELSVDELPAFVQLLERHRRQEDWPTKVVVELLYNKRLSLDELVDSQRSFSLYRNIIGSLSTILDRTSDGDTALDIKRLLNRIVDDSNFANLDVTTYSSLLYEVSRRKGQGSLNELRVRLLERIDFKYASIFHSAFFEALRGFFIEPVHAQRIIEKIVRYGKYPFHDLEFLIQLLECVDQATFENFLLRYSQPLFDSPYDAERFYRALATTIPERFAPVYMLNRRTFKRSFAKYSTTDKEIYKLCWPFLTFGQRLKSFILG